MQYLNPSLINSIQNSEHIININALVLLHNVKESLIYLKTIASGVLPV